MQIILSLFFGLLFGALSAYIAARRQRRATLWLFLGFLGGIFALLIVLLLPYPKEPAEDDVLSDWINKKTRKAPLLSENTLYSGKEWYYVDTERKSIGPINLAKLQDLYEENIINDETLVWYEGLGAWRKIKELEGLVL